MYRHHSLSTKFRAIELYNQGYGSRLIGRELGVYYRLILRWIALYKQLGESGLAARSYTYYTPEFKESVVREVLEKLLPCESVAIRYGVSETSVGSWVKQVQAHGYSSLSEIKPRGRPPKDMRRPKKQAPHTELEKLREENLRLKAEVALLKK